MAEYLIQGETLSDIADAIREKTGSTESIMAGQFPEAIAGIDTQENLDAELTTQDDLIAQIATALEGKAVPGGQSESWAGTLTITGPYAGYIDKNGCSLVVDQHSGNAFVIIHISDYTVGFAFTSPNVPSGVTWLTNKAYPVSGAADTYYTCAFTGITGKVNANVKVDAWTSTYNCTGGYVTLTYA